MLPVLLLGLLANAAGAQLPEAWPPQAPRFQFRQDPGPAPAEPKPIEQGLSALSSHNTAGLGAEARKALEWACGKEGVRVEKLSSGWALRSKTGETLALPDRLGEALRRLGDYFGLTEATLANPITHDELKAALLSEAGVARIRTLFERMIERRVRLGGKPLVPEIGGEATLGGDLELREMADPARPAFVKLSKAQDDTRAIMRLYAEDPEGMKAVDPDGLLKNFLDEWPAWEARDRPPKAERERLLKMNVSNILENSAATNLFDPAGQLLAIVSQSWSGRYVGFWHAHPPHFGASGWSGGEEPSWNDMELSREQGQNLTIAFDHEGFDAYDLSPLAGAPAPDLRKLKRVSYRSPEWQKHFQALYESVRSNP